MKPFLRAFRNNKIPLFRFRVCLVLLAVTSFLGGCMYRSPAFRSDTGTFRRIHAAVKISTPDTILSSHALVSIRDDTYMRIDIYDGMGLTRAVVRIDGTQVEFVNLVERCAFRHSGWLSGLSHACGVSLSYRQLTNWLFPGHWPGRPTTYRVAQRDRLQFDITVYPPETGRDGMTRIRIPGRDMELSVIWTDQYESEGLSYDGRFESFDRCELDNAWERVFR